MTKTLEQMAEEYAETVWDESDLAPEDKAVERHVAIGKHSTKIGFLAGYQAAVNSSSGWISVEDRLPEDGDDLSIMLVWRSIEHDYDTVRWRYQQGWDCVVQDKSTITHWMSLPKPPEEKK